MSNLIEGSLRRPSSAVELDLKQVAAPPAEVHPKGPGALTGIPGKTVILAGANASVQQAAVSAKAPLVGAWGP